VKKPFPAFIIYLLLSFDKQKLRKLESWGMIADMNNEEQSAKAFSLQSKNI
jgi:hypothetical protein